MMRSFVLAVAVALSLAPALAAESQSAAKTPAMTRLAKVWVEGPGFDITYGGTYAVCTSRCLASAQCVMIEYYRPEKKCNLYDAVRPTLRGGSSDVAIRR